MNAASAPSIDDLRALARRRLPRVCFDFIEGGAEGEVTLRANCKAFEQLIHPVAEEQDPEEAVDHGRDPCQELDEGLDGGPQVRRQKLGGEDRGTDAQWARQAERDRRDDHRSVDHRQGPEQPVTIEPLFAPEVTEETRVTNRGDAGGHEHSDEKHQGAHRDDHHRPAQRLGGRGSPPAAGRHLTWRHDLQ